MRDGDSLTDTSVVVLQYCQFCRGIGDVTPDDPEENVPTVQDSEINLLKSGELTWVGTCVYSIYTVCVCVYLMNHFVYKYLECNLTHLYRMAVPLSIDDISQFGDGSRELFIKSSCYSVIAVAVGDCGPTVSWVFSSEPKSVSFSVVYQESTDSQVEQSKVDELSVYVQGDVWADDLWAEFTNKCLRKSKIIDYLIVLIPLCSLKNGTDTTRPVSTRSADDTLRVLSFQ